MRKIKTMSETIYCASDFLNLFGVFAGIFFGNFVNPAASAGSGLGFSGSDRDKAFWNYFSCVFAATAVLSAISIGVLQLKKSRTSEQPESTLLINGEEEELTQQKTPSSIMPHERILNTLYILASPGALVGTFNVARFDDDFLAFVCKNTTTQSLFVANAIAMSLFAILAKPIQQKTNCQSAMLSAFIETCGKTGAWIGAIFALFLIEFVVFEKNKINSTEVHALTGVMAGLFMMDLCLLYAAIKKQGDLEKANQFIRSPLHPDASFSEKCLWWPSFVLDVMRALVGVVGNVLAVPNIISLSDSFNAATDGDVKKYTYAALSAVSLVCGANNAARVMIDRLQSPGPK